ncbi:hypothetical protein GCM10027589_46380 [Actinocorallia lasiicapitis]
MAELWLPGAERQEQSNGGTMKGGPPRAVWHITWDELDADGHGPGFGNVLSFLKRAEFCPHLMWDPWTGRIVQFYPATTSARALRHDAGTVETNRMGSRCLQIEIYFSPDVVRDGRKHATVADTPAKGLDQILAWLRSWDVPDAWPAGVPEWTGNQRSATVWRTKAGHYGHGHVPGNTHTDPGPLPRAALFAAGGLHPAPPHPRTLRLADPPLRGSDVKALQRALNTHGAHLTADGIFGRATDQAVRAFQRSAQLTPDGIVGPATRRALSLA